MVMEMPRRAGKHGRFMANSSNKVGEEYCEVVCRIIPIMDRFFSKRPKLVLHQVKLISKLINNIQYFSLIMQYINLFNYLIRILSSGIMAHGFNIRRALGFTNQ